MSNLDIIPIITQSGAVGIAVYLIYVLRKIITNHYAHINGVIERNTEAIIDEAKTHQAQVDVLQKQSEVLTRLLDLIERKL